MRLRPCEREEITSAALERVARDLAREPYLRGVSFRAAVIRKVKDQISDFATARARRRRLMREELTSPEGMPEVAACANPTPVEQAAAAEPMLRPLPPREREIVYERYVLDRSIGEVAACRGIQRDAVKKACTRGAGKMRKAYEARGVHGSNDARDARDTSDPNSMSTFSTSHSGIGDEGPTDECPRTGDSSVGRYDQKSKFEPHDGKSVRSGKRGM